MARLDIYDIRPAGMDAYLSYYGYHFSPAMAKWAVSMIEPRSGGRMQMMEKEEVDDLLIRNDITLKNDVAYDAVYVANMIKSDRFGSSVRDEAQLAKAIKDEIDDPDGYEGRVFCHFLADCTGKGVPIIWQDVV